MYFTYTPESMFTESSITGRYDYMDITEATQKFQIDVIDMLHEFTENVWITEATNVANGRRPYALFEAEGFWEKVKDMFRKAIAWIKDMYIRVKGWLLDKWEDFHMFMTKIMDGIKDEKVVKTGRDIYVDLISGKYGKDYNFYNKNKGGVIKSCNMVSVGISKWVRMKMLDAVINMIKNRSNGTYNTLEDLYKMYNDISKSYGCPMPEFDVFKKNVLKITSTNIDNIIKFAVYQYGGSTNVGQYVNLKPHVVKTAKGEATRTIHIGDTKIGSDNKATWFVDANMLDEAIELFYKSKNNFISRIMKHERDSTKILENTLYKLEKYQSGDTEYKNSHDDDADTVQNIDDESKKKDVKVTIEIVKSQIRFNTELCKQAVDAYRLHIDNCSFILGVIMKSQRLKKAIKRIMNGENRDKVIKSEFFDE